MQVALGSSYQLIKAAHETMVGFVRQKMKMETLRPNIRKIT